MADYTWQTELYPKWKEAGFRGICKSVTASGKTRAGCIALRAYLDEHPEAVPLVLSPSAKVNESWRAELDSHGLSEVPVMTYQTAVNRMLRNGLVCTVMVADECHRLATPVQGRVMELNPVAVLGLSATPEGSMGILGTPFMDIPIESANVCPFTIHYTAFTPTKAEMEQYDRITERMETRASEVTGGRQKYLRPGVDREGWNCYDALSRKRREVCYLFESRMPIVCDLVRKNIGRRTVVYFERQEQARKLSRMLDAEGIPNALHIQERSNFKDFEQRKVDVLIACKALREGYNDPSISCVIMGSINTRTIVNTQTIGRAMRIDPENPDKHADIYLLMADGTSDMKVTSSLDYPKQNIRRETIACGQRRL